MKHLLWLDLEMTGLDEKVHAILEVAVALTDFQLNIIEEYQKVVFQPPAIVDAMNDWCKKAHGESGLTASIPQGTPLSIVEDELLLLIDRRYKKDEQVVLAGNSIWNDRRFIDYYMPKFSRRLHYRMVDVSSFKEIFRHRYKIEVKKGNGHRALADIHEAIGELKTYLGYIQIPSK